MAMRFGERGQEGIITCGEQQICLELGAGGSINPVLSAMNLNDLVSPMKNEK